MIKEAIIKLSKVESLDYDLAYQVMDEIMTGEASEVQISSYLTALAVKGESIEEITASAAAMREHCVRLLHEEKALEIVGTGGDHSNSFNISTTSAIVVAAGGVPVAKHGNRASSSKSGSADVLEALGVNIMISPAQSAKLLREIGICFLFAQKYHLAMKYVASVRRELGIRSIFNILGPLSNPAGASMQVMGVYDEKLVMPLAQVLCNLGVERAMVVYGRDCLDEISMCESTKICEVKDGILQEYEICPEQFGYTRCDSLLLKGGDALENAEITRSIFRGELGAKRDAICLNAGAALYIAGKAPTLEDGVRLAESIIESGKAMEKLEEFILHSNEQLMNENGKAVDSSRNILKEIAEKTKLRVAEKKRLLSLEDLIEKVSGMKGKPAFSFEQALRESKMGFICEIKKASPSKGVIAKDFPYLEIAREYEAAGATALSCLTEPDYFQGADSYLEEIAKKVNIPILRKDFFIDPYMIYEAKYLGADCILLICSLLNDEELRSYYFLATSLGLSVIFEAHDKEEVERAVKAGASIIGVNNRNLKTFTMDLQNSIKLRSHVSEDILFISESGIKTKEDVAMLVQHGIQAILVGETLMRSDNKAEILEDFRSVL